MTTNSWDKFKFKKKLNNFSEIPEESSSEGRGFQADQPTDFDELLARTQATAAGKNARALQFDENSSATTSNQIPMSMILSCYCALFVLRL